MVVSGDPAALEVAGWLCFVVAEWSAVAGGPVLAGAARQADQVCLAKAEDPVQRKMAFVPVAVTACLKFALHPDGVRKGPIPDRLENMGASMPGKA